MRNIFIIIVTLLLLLPFLFKVDSKDGTETNDKGFISQTKTGYINEPVDEIMGIKWRTEYSDLAEELAFSSVREIGDVKDCMKFNNNPIDNVEIRRIDYFFFKNQFYMISLDMSEVTKTKMHVIREKYVNQFGSPHEKRESYFDAEYNITTPDIWIWYGETVNTIFFSDVTRNTASITYRFIPIDEKVPKKIK